MTVPFGVCRCGNGEGCICALSYAATLLPPAKVRKAPISDGLRRLVKKLAAYTRDKFSGGNIDITRTKHTRIIEADPDPCPLCGVTSRCSHR